MSSPEEIKARKAEYAGAYRAANPEKTKAIAKTYFAKHPGKNKIYYAANREKAKANYKVWAAANPQKIRDYARKYYNANPKKDYGLSMAEFYDLLNSQDGVCAICKKADWNGKRPPVDHNHVTGKVRGILCNNCNSALGFVNEDVAILKAMANYLEKQR